MRLFWADGNPLTDSDRDSICDADFRLLGKHEFVDFVRSTALVRDDTWDHVHGDSCDAPECCPKGEVTV